jgi:hypothetical protein
MSNKQPIPNPPGGELVCADNQLAVVHVINGEVFAECHSEPNGLRRAEQGDSVPAFLNWAMGIILKQRRPLEQQITPADYAIIDSRAHSYFRLNGDHVQVNFSLPLRSRSPRTTKA